ncbi:MAG: hypothetical protein AAF432_16590 [Planctomycetota bacterium]
MSARRPRRIRTQIIACVVMGFVASWVVMLALLAVYWRQLDSIEEPDARERAAKHFEMAERHGVDTNEVLEYESYHYRVIDIYVIQGPHQYQVYLNRHEQGFPFRMTWMEYARFETNSEPFVRGAITRESRSWSRYMPPIAYVPIWSGLIANTLFYATLFWLLWFAPRYVRRVMRVRREKCIMCAYPTKRGAICSECGTIASGIRWRGNA